MDLLKQIEHRRLQEQTRLDTLKDSTQRNRLGQFATPPKLALEIAQLAALYWEGREDDIRFLDPGFGTGAFYSALRQSVPVTKISSAIGVEIDPMFAEVARQLWGSDPFDVEIIEADFTQLPPPLPPTQPNLIICNPPYIRHHHLSQNRKASLKKTVQSATGLTINGLAGMYNYFLLLSHKWLASGGLGIWLIPAEFMDVNYGKAIKDYLTKQVTLRRIHRFEPADVQFSDALVSSAVVVMEKSSPSDSNEVEFTVGGTLNKPKTTYTVNSELLANMRKWTRIRHNPARLRKNNLHEIVFGDFFKTRRGIATGANSFFIITKEKAHERSLPDIFLKPILPSSRYLVRNTIEADPEGLPLVTPQLFLIDCNLPENEVHEEYPTLWEYLQEGRQRNIHLKYLSRTRSPWYRQEQLAHTPFLCTYMGRSKNEKSPFRFFWNKSRATVANSFHLIYLKGPVEALLKRQPERQEEVFRLLNQITSESLTIEGRTYGGGLHKIEPHELHRVSLTELAAAQELAAAVALF